MTYVNLYPKQNFKILIIHQKELLYHFKQSKRYVNTLENIFRTEQLDKADSIVIFSCFIKTKKILKIENVKIALFLFLVNIYIKKTFKVFSLGNSFINVNHFGGFQSRTKVIKHIKLFCFCREKIFQLPKIY